MAKLLRCTICGETYIGEHPSANCLYCGVSGKYVKIAKNSTANYDVDLNATDKKNAQTALALESSNVSFYFCASKKTNDEEGKILFKALGNVESRHAGIWKKILKLAAIPVVHDPCSVNYIDNIKGAHEREVQATQFYAKAANQAKNERVKELFQAIIGAETDHLDITTRRLNGGK